DYLLTGIRVASTGPGGISTAGGGDVILEAGHDVVSVPDVGPGQTPGGSGALGSQAGDVTVNAGHGIFGNFILQHGTGRLLAGVELGLDGSPTVTHPDATIGIATKAVSLSLASGSWSAYAARDIFIGEVRNPSGTFNSRRVPVPEGVFIGNSGVGGDILPPVRASFLFDYSPDAAARLWAGNGIHLLGANLPRVTGQNQGMPAIYPPTLSLEAGAGGIEIQNSLVLYPSQEGSLQITTHAGGGIHGGQQSGTLIGIVMSDSGLPDWNTFISGHAITPLHLNDPDPVKMEISGKVDSFGLAVPTVAQVHVHGDAYNFRFQGQNLSASAVTDLVVDGAIRYRGGLTSVTLDDLLPAVVYSPALSADPGIARKLRYDPATGKLSFYGQMTEGERTALLNPRALLFDSHGAPLDADHQVIDRPGVEQGWVYVPLTDGQKAAIRKLYTDSQDAALADQGLSVAGPGLFHVQAQKVDLGISSGISVRGPNFNPALEGISPLGANLSIDIAESLVMTTTKIANEGYRGGISLRVGESIDVGDQLSSFGSPADPKGIFTTSGGSLQVTAGRDINVNGSRIATYNGGTLTVRSEHGDVNAGVGGSGSVSFRTTDLDPATGKLVGIPSTIPGSGILATTVPGSFPDSVVGNITVQAPEGNINASLGGIIQLSFNGSDSRRSGIALTAGKDINAGGSGVIGNNISLDAGGNINGLVIGSGNIALRSEHNINVTAIGSGGVSVSAGGSVSGTIVSGGSVNVSGDSISAALVSKNVSASGDTSKAAVGVPTSNVAKSDTKVAEDAATLGGRTPEKSLKDQDESRSRPKPAPVVRKVSRVTVILPTNP
ncbi:MAG TPA: hypothetical protein DCM86_00150, partial [Verrucomicrobiales bacterium]|nr:hypothetical protein [Verrucomicrobiales bacterium]